MRTELQPISRSPVDIWQAGGNHLIGKVHLQCGSASGWIPSETQSTNNHSHISAFDAMAAADDDQEGRDQEIWVDTDDDSDMVLVRLATRLNLHTKQ